MAATPGNQQVVAWRNFLVVHTTLIELIENDLSAAGLPPLGWYDVLLAVEEADGRKLRMHELSRAVVLSRSNLTRLVDRMEKADLLYREPCPDDRRGAYAVVTDEGLAMRRRMWPVYARGIENYFARHLSGAEAKAMTRAFVGMLANVKASNKLNV